MLPTFQTFHYRQDTPKVHSKSYMPTTCLASMHSDIDPSDLDSKASLSPCRRPPRPQPALSNRNQPLPQSPEPSKLVSQPPSTAPVPSNTGVGQLWHYLCLSNSHGWPRMRLPCKTNELLAAKAATAPTMTLGNKTSEKRGAARTCQASAEAATELGLDFDRCVVGICELIGIVVVVDGEPVACATELRRKQEANTTMSTPGKEHQAKEWAGKAGSEQRNARTRVHECDCGRPEPPKLYSYYWHSYRYDSPAGPGRAGRQCSPGAPGEEHGTGVESKRHGTLGRRGCR